MPKARIATASVGRGGRLAEELRARGYTVEIIHPGDEKTGDADFELDLRSCSANKALELATKLAQTNNADIYVGPGCFTSEKKKDTVETVLPLPSVTDTVNGVAAGLQNKRDLMAKALREQRALMRQVRIAQRERREQETRRHAAAQAERERQAKAAEALRIAEEQERTVRRQHEEELRRRAVETERAQVARALQRNSKQSQVKSQVSPRTREWRAAFLIAAVSAAIFMIGWSVVVGGPLSPLPRRMTTGFHNVEQQRPFGAAIVKAPTPLEPTPATSSSVKQPVKPSAIMPQVPAANRTSQSNTVHRHASRTRRGKDEDLAEDEVRYLTPKRTKPAKVIPAEPQHASLKRYSDME